MPSPAAPWRAIADTLVLSSWHRATELARPWLLLAAYVVVCVEGWWPLAPLLALACFLAAFVQLHDAMHRSLGLPRWANELVIGASGMLLLKSGHALLATHMRHHGRVLAKDDPEAGVVHLRFLRVLWAGPFLVLGNRRRALEIAPRTRVSQLAETGLTVFLLAAAIELERRWGSPAGLVYWAVAAMLSGTMALWAGYLPHTLSSRRALIRWAAWAARGWTPVVNSLAYHDLHHRFPRVPTSLLPALAKRMGPDEAFADETIHPGPAAREGRHSSAVARDVGP
jgi:fatty acid desaturase